MHITFIQTGGTIDKDYPRSDADHGYEFKIGRPAVKNILPTCHPLFTYDVVELLKKDSLDLTDKDRHKIAEAVKKMSSDKIIITHGTDTTLKTAELLDSTIKNKTIVLTGAMLPEKFAHSDAKFNLGMAVAAVQVFPAGVYITLYGHAVPWKDFRELHEEYEVKSRAAFLAEASGN
jgi:L-asparaginase